MTVTQYRVLTDPLLLQFDLIFLFKKIQKYFALKFSVVKLQFRTVAVPTTLDLKTLFHVQLSSWCILHSELLGFCAVSMDKTQKLIRP